MKTISLQKQKTWNILAAALAFLLIPSPAVSADRFELLNTQEIAIQGDVVDIAVTDDSRWTFVLTTRGEVAVLDSTGKLTQTINVGNGFERLEYTRSSNKLVLGGSQGKLKIVTLSMRYDIDTSGSPYRGPEEAPVTIVVFTDYQ